MSSTTSRREVPQDPLLSKGAQLKTGDCFEFLPTLKNDSIHLILTDPPYFTDKLDDSWSDKKINTTNSKAVHNLPAGMKFSAKQSRNFGAFFARVAKEAYRVLVPGGFFISFSQGRLYQRMAVATEDERFLIKDMLAWHYTKKAQAKAFSLDHFIDKRKISENEKKRLKKKLMDRKTPQLKPAFEPMMLAQKPLEGRFTDNFLHWGVGLIDSSVRIEGAFPANLIKVEKPGRKERFPHPTQKPLKLLEHLIELFTQEGQTVLDPFLGSGTTAVACYRKKRKIIGCELETKYMDIAKERLEEEIAKNS